jgi:hypothetical protein
MWRDPIVQEIRKLRGEYAARFKNDPDAIFNDILKRQKASNRSRVSFPAKKSKKQKNVA